MVMCFVPDCKHYSEKHTCRFFRFPKDETNKRIWITAIRRADRTPNTHSSVCNCHFVNGDKRNFPTLFDRGLTKCVVSPKNKRKRPKILGEPLFEDQQEAEYILPDVNIPSSIIDNKLPSVKVEVKNEASLSDQIKIEVKEEILSDFED